MVQRKIPDKLGIPPAETRKYVTKADKQKPSCTQQYQDAITRNKGGAEMKKKMKKSRSFKVSTDSHPRQEKPKLGKSTMIGLSATAVVTLQKSSPIKVSDVSPNYMKPTSSSDARKERAPVSSRSPQASCDIKSQKQRSSKNSSYFSPSGHKPARSLTKSDSLKPVRTLTKSFSTKATRPSMKKSSGVALYPDLNVGRATCSSTIKDSKFPEYLLINPGRTESEGTSVTKVCPYTYCSLNGHHHAPLPPLKCFLKARRRSLRTQKSMKLNCLSPRKAKPGKTKKEIDTGQMDFDNTHIEETGMEFFVEIYAEPRKSIGQLVTTRSIQDGDDTLLAVANSAESARADKVSMSLLDEQSYSEISFEDLPELNSDFVLAEMGIYEPDQQKETDESKHSLPIVEAEANLECCCLDDEPESRTPAEIEVDESAYEPSDIDMDWEDLDVLAQFVPNESDQSIIDEFIMLTDSLTGIKDSGLPEAPVFQPDDIVNDYYEEIPENGDESQKSFEEKAEACYLELSTRDVESVVGETKSEYIFTESEDHLSSSEDAYEQPAASSEGKDGDTRLDEFINSMATESSLVDPLEELRSTSQEDKVTSTADNDLIPENLVLEDNEVTGSGVYTCPTEEQEAEPEIQISVGYHIDAEVGQELNGPEDQNSADQSIFHVMRENQELQNEDQNDGRVPRSISSTHPEEHDGLQISKFISLENSTRSDESHVHDKEVTDAVDACLTPEKVADAEKGKTIIKRTRSSHPQVTSNCSNLKFQIGCKKHIAGDIDELRKFNPREPNYLSVEPDPEAEKVDLRQQMMDERKNADEWMLDFALRQAVSKLAPARKRKVALLVEAFETVAPRPKLESRLKHVIPGFTHTRPMQACS